MQAKSRRTLALLIPIAALLALCAGLWLGVAACNRSKVSEMPPEPSLPISHATAAPSLLPSPSFEIASPDPDATAPAMYQLPLVPLWDEGETEPTLSPAPTAAPQKEIQFEPMTGLYTDTCKDFLAVGIENGIATAILLVRLEGDTLTILSLPAQTLGDVYTLDKDCRIVNVSQSQIGTAVRFGGSDSNQSMWNLAWSVKNLVGFRAPQYIGLDLACLEEILSIMDGVQGGSAQYTAENCYELLYGESGMHADMAADFGAGLIRKLRDVSIWELPAMQRATRSKICSSLSARQLVALGKDFKSITSIRCELLPTLESGTSRTLDAEAAYQLVNALYK